MSNSDWRISEKRAPSKFKSVRAIVRDEMLDARIANKRLSRDVRPVRVTRAPGNLKRSA